MKENINNFLMLCVKVIILCKDCLKNIKKIATLSSETIQNDLVTSIVSGVLNEF